MVCGFCQSPDPVLINIKAIQDAKFYYVGGFFLTHGLESVLELAKLSVKDNKVGPNFSLTFR